MQHRVTHIQQRIRPGSRRAGARGWRIRGSAEQIVGGRKIKVEFPRVFGLELTHLQFVHKIAMQPDMVEDKIEVEGLPVHFQRNLKVEVMDTFAEPEPGTMQKGISGNRIPDKPKKLIAE
ncbi:hypothetical protein [Granulicella sp. WH15]|uniref:hypothetical protein n=1 Tax=Granulicella sp. WH15 TaxID=2602070 RepID=UPI002104468D|nr:hypothetical protein [Granulicella sp. WH15]